MLRLPTRLAPPPLVLHCLTSKDGCRNIWYCSADCQRRHWRFHIFDCKREKPIDTAYHLARACYADLEPIDAQTRIDYGFDKASRILGPHAETMICGLWIGVFVVHNVDAKEVCKWRKEGRLVEGIKETYERNSEGWTQGAYYPWFLQHQWLLDGTPVDEMRAHQYGLDAADKMLCDGWVYAGGSSNDTAEDIRRTLATLPRDRAECHRLYALLISGAHPNPSISMWLSFGFVSAMDPGEEMQYARKYKELIELCTFNEFSAAYETSSIPALFDRYEVDTSVVHFPMNHSPLFLDVMSGSPRSYKSVWVLKQYIDQLICAEPDDVLEPVPSAAVDYGFVKCRNALDRKLLDDLYRRLFSERDADPLALHEACLKGQLLEYAQGSVKLAPYLTRYKRLLGNQYPLHFVAEEGHTPDQATTTDVRPEMLLEEPSYELPSPDHGHSCTGEVSAPAVCAGPSNSPDCDHIHLQSDEPTTMTETPPDPLLVTTPSTEPPDDSHPTTWSCLIA
ncbi:hypothetical protein DICSQDRAFT_161066 [Dichomitus squalens LYAD-421 SS1]|uniref:MYND-type domain-containing protein n=1 Tax=Dichomitus squalens (strain LYAD-421) TaxID=732165 RepID=R7T2B6_DICSQ|nr:uncharacterized protein DICSQDRAFT_161066 [Dichomitus squalens LYAD-421 SS1]EJF62170.1 hypothetical protein DICSQDRAFT_161066 [Dichomitus squalens LYAD-421 SS1]